MMARRQGSRGRLGGRRRTRLAALVLVALAALVWPRAAMAGPPAMIPPGQEQAMRGLVRAALAQAEEAGELPLRLSERVDIHVDRDHFRIMLHARAESGEAPGAESGGVGQVVPVFSLHHPEAFGGEGEARGGRILAPGVALHCGEPERARPCALEQARPWRALAGRFAQERAALVTQIWRVEERAAGPSVELDDSGGPSEQRARWLVDRMLVLFAALLGAGLWVFAGLRARTREHRVRWPELAALAALVAGYVGATIHYTAMLPLHEHNSFVARSDCAVSPTCLDDPMSAWNLGSLNGYGLLLEQLPEYSARSLAQLSLALSAVLLVLLWALARVLLRRLGRPELAAVAGLVTVAVWVTQPIAWRLGSSASFWPWALVWTVSAALAGLWAGELGQARARSAQLGAWLGWQFGALALVLASGGNFVLLTLGACHLLAPAAWSSAWELPAPERRARWLRGVLTALPTLALVAYLSAANLLAGLERTAQDSLGAHLSWGGLRAGLDTLLLDGRLGTRVWALGLCAALMWLLPRVQGAGGAKTGEGAEAEPGLAPRWRGLRLLTPLLYAWFVPSLFLAAAGGEVVGSGYPVGFINHHWELCFSALAVGLGLAWLVAALEQRWPRLVGLAERLPDPLKRALGSASWAVFVPLLCMLVALRQNPRSDAAWRLATGTRVVERELLALERAFAELPAHELLIIPPQLAEPMCEAPSHWDPIEVNFPVHTYTQAMRARGLEPARILPLDRVELDGLSERYDALVYVGSGLRSFQPHELEAGVVNDALERTELLRLREYYALEAVHEFSLEAAQHEAISMRLGADRLGELELGFYRLRPIHRP